MCGKEEFSKNIELGFQILVALVMIGLVLWGTGWVLYTFFKPIMMLTGAAIAIVLLLWSIGWSAKWLDKKIGKST